MFWRSNKNAYLCKVKQEIGIMTTMTLQIDNPSIFEHLKSILGLMKGVTIVGMTDSLDVDIPNETTPSAMKEASILPFLHQKNAKTIRNTKKISNFVHSI